MPDVVRVTCSVPNGVELRLFEPREEPLGVTTMVQTGETARLLGPTADGPGHTDVDKAFYDKWLEQNPDSPLLARGLIRVEEEKPDADDGSG